MHNKESFIELGARQRAKAILDSGSFREILGPLTAWNLRGWNLRNCSSIR